LGETKARRDLDGLRFVVDLRKEEGQHRLPLHLARDRNPIIFIVKVRKSIPLPASELVGEELAAAGEKLGKGGEILLKGAATNAVARVKVDFELELLLARHDNNDNDGH